MAKTNRRNIWLVRSLAGDAPDVFWLFGGDKPYMAKFAWCFDWYIGELSVVAAKHFGFHLEPGGGPVRVTMRIMEDE